MSDLTVDGMAVAPNVVETIVSMAVQDVEGVAGLISGRKRGRLAKADSGLEIVKGEDGSLLVSVHIECQSGRALPDLAKDVRVAVADAVAAQIGMAVSSVDVYIDSIQIVN